MRNGTVTFETVITTIIKYVGLIGIGMGLALLLEGLYSKYAIVLIAIATLDVVIPSTLQIIDNKFIEKCVEKEEEVND